MKKNALTLVIGGLLVAVFFLLLFVFQVRTTEVAVVTRFGRVVRTCTEPGPYLKLPWPIEKFTKFDKRIKNFDDQDRLDQTLTADSFNVITKVYVGWHINAPEEFFKRFPDGSVSEAEKTLQGVVRDSKNAVIGQHPLSDLVNTNAQALKFDAIEDEILNLVQKQLANNNYGLKIDFLRFQKLGLPESVTTAVFDRMKAERGVLASDSANAGEREAQKIRSDADRKAAELMAGATAEATRILGLGEAEAAKYLATFQKNPGLANFLFKLNALEASLKDRTTLVFDQHTAPFDLFRSLGNTSTNATPR